MDALLSRFERRRAVMLLAASLTPACLRMRADAAAFTTAKPVDASLLCNVPPARRVPPGCAEDKGNDSVRDRPDVLRVLRAQEARLQACYDAALERTSSVTGRVDFQVIIDAQGSVSDTCLERSQIDDNELVECAREVFLSLEFPAVACAHTLIRVPLIFAERRSNVVSGAY